MRILIDLQGAQSDSRHRGIGRYTLALALGMVRNPGPHEVHLLLNGMLGESIRPIRDTFTPWVPRTHIHVWHGLAPVNANNAANATRRHIAAIVREEAICHIHPDVVHITSLYDGYGDNAVHSVRERASCPVAITFYDAIPLIQTGSYLDNDPAYRNHYMACTAQAQKADLLLAISESARQEAITHLQVPPDQVVNISSAADACFKPTIYTDEQTRELQQRLRISKPFVMYSGATDERKNHRGLISAYARLPKLLRSQHQMVLAGGLPPHHRAQLEAHARGSGLAPDEVIITDRISDDDMVQLYNQCTLYVFASWHEGFGLPALEAMSCGAPTIGANTTSVPEVIGWDRALFDPHQPAAIAQKIAEALTDQEFRQELKAHALTRATQFSWDKSAQRAIAALEALPIDSSPGSRSQPDLLEAIAKFAAGDCSLDLLAVSQAIARNVKPAARQLLLDISELVQHDARTGIQRVVRSILHEWLKNPPQGYEVRAVYADAKTLGYRYANQFVQRFIGATASSTTLDSPIDYAAGDIFLALDMQPNVQVAQAPFHQRLRCDGVTVLFVLYDLLPILMPQFFPPGAAVNHTRWIRAAAATDGVICISSAVADELRDWLKHEPDLQPLINWFHMGAVIENPTPNQGLPVDAQTTLQQLFVRPTLLMVGTLEPRKGHAQVLDAIEELWRDQRDINLVIVGKLGWHMDEFAQRLRGHPEYDKRLFWFNGIGDEYLELIYKNSDCLIAASYGEGFGLPLIEAAQHKLPIIARDIPVFREVAGDYAYYFSSEQPGELAKALRDWLSLYRAAQHPRSDAMPWLTWEQSANNLAKILLTFEQNSDRCQGITSDDGLDAFYKAIPRESEVQLQGANA